MHIPRTTGSHAWQSLNGSPTPVPAKRRSLTSVGADQRAGYGASDDAYVDYDREVRAMDYAVRVHGTQPLMIITAVDYDQQVRAMDYAPRVHGTSPS